MGERDRQPSDEKGGPGRVRGYGLGRVDTVISVMALAGDDPYLSIENLRAGYGKMQILHDFNLRVGRGQSLCLIGPNGAGKSTVLHSVFGFTSIYGGSITSGGAAAPLNVTGLSPSAKLKSAGIAYILQDKSVFPDMTVEENL
jgi:branched-chain amino acid transport system ATP-binding protein